MKIYLRVWPPGQGLDGSGEGGHRELGPFLREGDWEVPGKGSGLWWS